MNEGIKALLRALLAFAYPLLQKWLEDLLKSAADRLDARGFVVNDPMVSVDALFDEARSQLWWFQLAKIRALSRARAVARGRAAEFVAAARGGAEPYPTLAEILELKDTQI